MNTVSTTDSRHQHPPQHEQLPLAASHPMHARPVRRVGLADRVALHLGLALIKWGRRPVARHERIASRAERALLQHEREHALAVQRQRAEALSTVSPARLR